MIDLRRAAWVLPVALAALAVTVVVAVVLARREHPSRALLALTPAVVNAGTDAAPEIATLNAQLAQIAALRADTSYGDGLNAAARAPVPSLRAVLGEEWHELRGPVGRARVRATGTPSQYFEVSLVAVPRGGFARLAIATEAGERASELVSGPYRRINFGPLRTAKRAPLSLAFSSLQAHSEAPGPSLILSPLQAEYLAAGEWVMGMPALAEVGPGGLRGVYLASGSTTPFAMTPGIAGACELELQGASVGGPAQVTVTVGSQARSALVSERRGVIRLGPFPQASPVLTLSVSAPKGSPGGALFIAHLGFVAVSQRAK